MSTRDLEWHPGTHAWEEHDGFPRHQHSMNGLLTIVSDDPYPHFQGGRKFDTPASKAVSRSEQVTELGVYIHSISTAEHLVLRRAVVLAGRNLPGEQSVTYVRDGRAEAAIVPREMALWAIENGYEGGEKEL